MNNEIVLAKMRMEFTLHPPMRLKKNVEEKLSRAERIILILEEKKIKPKKKSKWWAKILI
jgi:hypothetical protein